MTFVLTDTIGKKRLLIVMSSNIIPFAFRKSTSFQFQNYKFSISSFKFPKFKI